MKSSTAEKIAFVFFILSFSNLFIFAQPSGGPYGPVWQKYDAPKVSGTVYYVSPTGNAQEKGDSPDRTTTIEAAFERVKTGDAIILRGGTYRTGNLILNQGITIQPYADELPVLKGTYVASEWKDLRNGLWVTNWSHLFPAKPADWWTKERSGRETPLHRFNDDMVFIDGKFLQSAGWFNEVNENNFYIDYENGKVYIGTDPKDHLVEITAFNVAIHRITGEVNGKTSDRKGPVIRGITFTQYAYRALEVDGTEPEGPADESTFGKDVVGTVLENCEISYCSRVAAYLRGDGLKIKNCKVSNTSTEGIYVLSSSDVLLEKNIFTKNNIERITGYYPAAVKIFNQTHRVTCNDNLVTDLPFSNGIWYDVGNVDGVFINNRIEGVGLADRKFTGNRLWPSENGFFFEISKGAICAGNVFVNCEQGILILNSSDVKVYQNTFINSTACIGRDGRSAVGDHFGWHPSTGPDVDEREGHIFVNNVLYGDENFKRPLLFVWQPNILCAKLSSPQLKQLDYNLFSNAGDAKDRLVLWSPAANEKCQLEFNSPSGLNNQYPQFCSNCQYLNSSILFQSPYLGNYKLLNRTDIKPAAVLPVEIMNVIGLSKKYKPYFGAYPLVQ